MLIEFDSMNMNISGHSLPPDLFIVSLYQKGFLAMSSLWDCLLFVLLWILSYVL